MNTVKIFLDLFYLESPFLKFQTVTAHVQLRKTSAHPRMAINGLEATYMPILLYHGLHCLVLSRVSTGQAMLRAVNSVSN